MPHLHHVSRSDGILGNVACSSLYQPCFSKAKAGIKPMLIRPFHLTASQRKKDVSKFVDALLRGDMGEAKGRYQIVKNSGFKILLTRSLEKAKDYCRNQYAGKRKKKFGRIASSGKIF